MLFSSVNLDASGKQQGYLQVPYSHNLGGWANVMIPITIVANGSGPTVLVLGGNHGDEYQGQIAAMKLARELTPEMICGRIILIPSLNFPAARTATRLSPLDGMNMNRAFPGQPEGCVTSQIAHYLTTVLFPMSDVVIDIHSGGRSMDFVPCSHMHVVPDKEQRKQMLNAMLAWNTDFSFLYADIAGSGLLPVEAENQRKIVVTTELGGGEGVPASVHRIAQSGLRNVLIHVGLLKGVEKTRESLGKPPTILVQALDRDDYLLAPESGILEINIDLGQKVNVGDCVGAIHHLERPDRTPEPIVARSTGYMITARVPCLTQQGDCVAVIAGQVSIDEVLSA
ncbi:MAG: succinylglutamate desuccinylase/aspartoacylase family protein [Pirellulaceae bacterium]